MILEIFFDERQIKALWCKCFLVVYEIFRNTNLLTIMEFEREHLCVLPEMERASKQITVSGLRQRLWDSFFSLFFKSQVSTLPFGCFCFFFYNREEKGVGGAGDRKSVV